MIEDVIFIDERNAAVICPVTARGAGLPDPQFFVIDLQDNRIIFEPNSQLDIAVTTLNAIEIGDRNALVAITAGQAAEQSGASADISQTELLLWDVSGIREWSIPFHHGSTEAIQGMIVNPYENCAVLWVVSALPRATRSEDAEWSGRYVFIDFNQFQTLEELPARLDLLSPQSYWADTLMEEGDYRYSVLTNNTGERSLSCTGEISDGSATIYLSQIEASRSPDGLWRGSDVVTHRLISASLFDTSAINLVSQRRVLTESITTVPRIAVPSKVGTLIIRNALQGVVQDDSTIIEKFELDNQEQARFEITGSVYYFDATSDRALTASDPTRMSLSVVSCLEGDCDNVIELWPCVRDVTVIGGGFLQGRQVVRLYRTTDGGNSPTSNCNATLSIQAEQVFILDFTVIVD